MGSPTGQDVCVFVLFLVNFVSVTPGQKLDDPSPDGFRNNLNQPAWGIAGSNFLRVSPNAYSDGAYEMSGKDRPNPLEVSLRAHHSGPIYQPSSYGRNALQAFYGQLVLDEIAQFYMSGCPPEYENMPLPDKHPLRNFTERPHTFLRSLYDQSTGYTSAGPRQQINLVSSFLDGGVIYGTSKVWTSLLRSYKKGMLLSDSEDDDDDDDDIKSSFPAHNTERLPMFNAPIPRDHNMKPVDRLFRLGNGKGHENPFLLALQVIWFRYHNKLAQDLSKKFPELSDEELFQTTKRKVVAVFQKIAMNDWLPAFLNGNETRDNNTRPTDISPYTKYNSRTQPGVTQEFLVAMEFRNTITPSAIWALGETCNFNTTRGRGPNGEDRTVTSYRLCNHFWDPQSVVKKELEAIIQGMIYTKAKVENGKYVEDYSESFYGPFEYSRNDHVGEQIQRFRDHGLSGLNTIRRSYGLDILTDWARLGGANGTLQTLYGGSAPNDLDLLTGGLLDKDQKNGMSDVFRSIILEQFTRVRDTDRFWYQNKDVFNATEILEIEGISFVDVLEETTHLTNLPSNVFVCDGSVGQCSCKDPPNMDYVSNPEVEICSPLATYDYITGSEWSFALSFLALALVIPVSIGVLCCMVKKKKVVIVETNKRKSTLIMKNDKNKFRGNEYLGKSSGYRDVRGELKSDEQRIVIRDPRGRDLRYVDFKSSAAASVTLHLSSDKDLSLLCLKVPGDIDLILRFPGFAIRESFVGALERFLSEIGISLDTQHASETSLFSNANDKDQRQKLLDKFFRAVCLTAFDGTGLNEDDRLDLKVVDEVIHIKLTMTEFADAMGMQPSSLFVKNVFLLADINNDRYLAFEEFLHLFAIFLKGTAEEKSRLLFNIYDVRKVGYLTKDEFYRMIKSLLDLAESADLTDGSVKDLVTSMFKHVGLTDASQITIQHFQKIFCSEEYSSTLQNATILGKATQHAPTQNVVQRGGKLTRRNTFIKSYISNKHKTKDAGRSVLAGEQLPAGSRISNALNLTVGPRQYPRTSVGQVLHSVSRYIDRYRLQIFWAVLYTLVTIGIFVERAFFFAKGREHAGLRRMSGAWITAMIRGSASVIMFTYSSLLVTMCRNTITALRETFLHRFIPFDSAVSFHKYIAVLAIIGTLVHVVTHAMNLYCMCTQSTTSINCFFGEYKTETDSFATFHYWAYQTITGLTGVLVTVLIFIMYVFATQFARRHVFKAFWLTHSLYWLVYVLTFLHGVGRLVQAPLFSWYLIGPLILFIIDRLQSTSRNKVEISVKSATPLPSGVLRLVFKRPATFNYKSGQWVRIACTELSETEYHPFTLTSAPHESHLSLHIRAVGPWTTNLRKIYSPGENEDLQKLPNLFLDGPFGEGHQDWYSCEVAVLVGGGIGVTPFASILKDIAFKSKTGIQVTCKKVYFIWVTRTQHSFEWLVDIIRDVEAADLRGIVDTHIFVTQFQQRYDLRTTMLYICERYFQKVEGKSLFTGLKAVTHFGRPNFEDFFWALTEVHKDVSQVGVFSCGPGPMTSNVQKACNAMNSLVGPTFTHHFENF
ncbi:dual oxidase 1-like [Physella acuta]|uniref:dual oxidase 1-like n=1 Tax=Physella acuta TaxID=109671 RepID=UPI0027DC87A0|nr:dual oxidase 1-like [Physella acuta]